MTFTRGKDLATLALVLVAAAFMRFSHLGDVEFFHDEAMVSMMAQEMADGQTFPLQGILSSVGIPNPPTSIYTVAVPFTFSNDPVFVTGFIVLLNVAAIGLLWLIARQHFGFTAALVAGLLFAVNPWAVLYSRKIWAQDYLNPFLLFALFAALKGFWEGRRWGQILALPLMLYAMQIHFAGWALVPLFGWIMLSGRQNIRRGPFAAGLLLGALILLPYAVGLLQTLQADPTRIGDVLNRSGGARSSDLNAILYAGWLASGVPIEAWTAPLVERSTFAPINTLAQVMGIGFGLFAIAGTILIAPRRRWFVAFLLWIPLPVVVFQIGLADIWPHYFVPQLPAFALLGGIAGAALFNRLRYQSAALVSTAALIFCIALGVQGAYYFHVMQFAYTHNIALSTGTSGYTTPMSILNAVRASLPPDIDDVLILSDGDRVWFDVEAARWPVILRDEARCVRSLPVQNASLAPAGRFAVIIAPTAPDALRKHYSTSEDIVIPARNGEGEYHVAIFDDAITLSDDIAFTAAQQRFANDVILIGHAVSAGTVTLAFSLPDAPDRTFYGALNHEYQYFVHLLDGDGNRIGQADASFWSGRHWCAGDTLRLTIPMENATDAALLRFGFYRILDAEAGTTQALDILDSMGNPAGNWVDLPLE